MKSRATAFACAAGALVFTLSLVLGYSPDQQDDLNQVGRALIIAILCGTLSWASTSRSMAATAAAVDTATERLLSAAHGDLQSPVSPNISAELPDLSVAMK